MCDVMHPYFEMDHKSIHLTDIEDDAEFASKWLNERLDVREEFGFDLPFHNPTADRLCMRYKEYVQLIVDYLSERK